MATLVTFLRRFLVLVAFAFWQGGFTFYAGVVVPVGREVDAEFQSSVTTTVSHWLNFAGGIALLYLTWDAATRDPAGWRRWARLAACGAMGALLVVLVRLRLELVREFYRPYHRLYLWTHALQWGCGLAYLALTVLAWRAQDRQAMRLVVLEREEPRADHSQQITQGRPRE